MYIPTGSFTGIAQAQPRAREFDMLDLGLHQHHFDKQFVYKSEAQKIISLSLSQGRIQIFNNGKGNSNYKYFTYPATNLKIVIKKRSKLIKGFIIIIKSFKLLICHIGGLSQEVFSTYWVQIREGSFSSRFYSPARD